MPTRRSFLKALAAAPAAAVMTTELAKAAVHTPVDPRLRRPPTAPEGFIWVREVDVVQCGAEGIRFYEHHPASRHILVRHKDAARHIYLRNRLAVRSQMHPMDFEIDGLSQAERWLTGTEEEE